MFERGKRDTDFGNGAGTTAPTSRSDASTPPGRSASEGPAVIGRSIKINGDLRGSEDLRIEGDVSGTVELQQANLTIGKEGRVKADVYAKSITVDGTMEGDLYASERVNIRASARIVGNATSPRVALEEGAKFKGAIEMDQEAVDKAFGKTSAAAAKPTPVEAPKRSADKAPDTAPKEAVSN